MLLMLMLWTGWVVPMGFEKLSSRLLLSFPFHSTLSRKDVLHLFVYLSFYPGWWFWEASSSGVHSWIGRR